MSWLHFHGKRPAVDPETGAETGELEEYEDDIEVNGPVRVQASTARGFQSRELSADGLSSVELSEEVPAAVQKERDAEEKAATASSSKTASASS